MQLCQEESSSYRQRLLISFQNYISSFSLNSWISYSFLDHFSFFFQPTNLFFPFILFIHLVLICFRSYFSRDTGANAFCLFSLFLIFSNMIILTSANKLALHDSKKVYKVSCSRRRQCSTPRCYLRLFPLAAFSPRWPNG